MYEKPWYIVIGWNYFEKDTFRKQLIRAVDSVAANLSEGDGVSSTFAQLGFNKGVR